MIKGIKFSNFKGRTKSYRLDRINIFAGPNGSGKSTVLEATRVALGGYISELGKLPSATMNLASGNEMSVEITDGVSTIRRTFTRDGSSTHQVIELDGEQVNAKSFVMPESMDFESEFINVSEFMGLTASKKTEYIMTLLDGEYIKHLADYESVRDSKLENEREIKRLTTLIQSVTGLKKVVNPSLENTFEEQEDAFLEDICDKLGKITPEVFRSFYADFRHKILFIRQSYRDAVYNEVLDRQRAEAELKKMELSAVISEQEKSMKAIIDRMIKGIESCREKMEKPFNVITRKAFGKSPYIEFTKNGKPNMSFGLVSSDGLRIPFETLSGGEKTILATALIASIQSMRFSKPKIGFFELAEADSESFRHVIDSISALGYEQAFIATCHATPETIGTCDVSDINFYNLEEK